MSNSDNLSNEGTGATFEETVSSFERLLDPDTGTTDAPEELSGQDDEAEDYESEALEANESEDDAQADDSDEDEEADAEDEDATDEDEDNPEDVLRDLSKKVPVKINGQTEYVTAKEAADGYQRLNDYRQKTAEVANERNALYQERQAFEADLQQVRQERQQYAYLLDQLTQQLQSQAAQQPDWQYLYENDPLEYLRQKDAWRDHQVKLQAAQAERARLEQAQYQEQVQAYQSMVSSEREQMLAKMPQWKDPKVWARDRAAIIEYGVSLGFSEADLKGASDHRAVIAMYNAMKAAKVTNSKPKAAPARTNDGPKPLTTQGKTPRREDSLTKANKRLKQSGSIRDAAEVFKHLL